MGRSTINTVDVEADGIGLSSRAGTALLALMAQAACAVTSSSCT